MNRGRWVVGFCIVLAGCAWFHQAVQDYRVGATAPVGAGEVSPAQRARDDTAPLHTLPYGGLIAAVAAAALGVVYKIQRGRQLRQAGVATPPSPLVHVAATVAAGVFEHGPDGSPVKRSWKTIVAGLLAVGVTLIPQVNAWAATSHWKFAGTLVGVTSLIMGLEKALSNRQPSLSPPAVVP